MVYLAKQLNFQKNKNLLNHQLNFNVNVVIIFILQKILLCMENADVMNVARDYQDMNI